MAAGVCRAKQGRHGYCEGLRDPSRGCFKLHQLPIQLEVLGTVDLPPLRHRPIRLTRAVQRQFTEVLGARQASDEQIGFLLAELVHALILQLCEEPSIARPKHDCTHVRLGEIAGLEGALDEPAIEHGLQISRDALDERPAAGG
ncbi:hypothetical protein D3C73_1142770 [compost metagenome]